MDRHDEVAGDGHVELAQQWAARAGPRVDAEGDEEDVAAVLLDLWTLVERERVFDRQRMQPELGRDSIQLLVARSLGSSQKNRRFSICRSTSS